MQFASLQDFPDYKWLCENFVENLGIYLLQDFTAIQPIALICRVHNEIAEIFMFASQVQKTQWVEICTYFQKWLCGL